MSDPDPVDELEMRQAMRGLAQMMVVFVEELREYGFSDSESMRLAAAYLSGIAARPNE
jgi:hypothetical protein